MLQLPAVPLRGPRQHLAEPRARAAGHHGLQPRQAEGGQGEVSLRGQDR